MQHKRKEKHICWENTWTKNGGEMCCWTCCISVIDLYLRCTKDPYFIINEL